MLCYRLPHDKHHSVKPLLCMTGSRICAVVEQLMWPSWTSGQCPNVTPATLRWFLAAVCSQLTDSSICMPGPVDFSSKNGSATTDKAMLTIMQGLTGASETRTSGQQLTSLQLKEEGIAKVCTGAMHLVQGCERLCTCPTSQLK